jgi:2',3'-cyclic-nucleotide 2'-phosphodiesterase (5'-nucleotidase family)
MPRPLTAAALALALTPGLSCLQYNDPCQPLVDDPDEVVGYLSEDVYLDKPYTRHDNNALGEVVADAFRHAEDESSRPAEMGIVNGGALRAEGLCATRTVAPKGPLRNGHLHEILLFENPVVTVDLTEQQLVAMMEHSVEALYLEGQAIVSPSGAFLHVSEGTSLTVDCSRPKGQRVTLLKVNTKTVSLPPRTDPSIRYRVAMPNYILNGGDGYGAILGDVGKDPARNPVTALKETGTDADLTAGYMRQKYSTETQPLSEDGRILFQHCAKPLRPVR